ncbi:MAG: hypothetical protein U0165_01345 [Polyangiaceae bacterium]
MIVTIEDGRGDRPPALGAVIERDLRVQVRFFRTRKGLPYAIPPMQALASRIVTCRSCWASRRLQQAKRRRHITVFGKRTDDLSYTSDHYLRQCLQ